MTTRAPGAQASPHLRRASAPGARATAPERRLVGPEPHWSTRSRETLLRKAEASIPSKFSPRAAVAAISCRFGQIREYLLGERLEIPAGCPDPRATRTQRRRSLAGRDFAPVTAN